MKKLITFFGVFTALSIVAPRAAVGLSMNVIDSRQDQCSSEAKAALYDSFLKHRQTDQAKANDEAKKYLACPAGEVTETQQKIIEYLKKYSNAYEESDRKIRLLQLIYNERKYAEAYQLAKEVLAKEPDNLRLLVHLGANGYLLHPLNNQVLNAQALDYATRALQKLESGQTIENWEPISREMGLAYLNYTVGTLRIEKEPKTANTYLMKAVQFETPLKKSPYTYAYIAGAYETGDYAKLSQDYKSKFSGKDETPESKLALANIYEVVDRMIDGYARAVALAGNDPKFASVKSNWSDSVVTWYKFRHGSDAGMSEMVANILTKPLPPPPALSQSVP